jgi:hypothetical protein
VSIFSCQEQEDVIYFPKDLQNTVWIKNIGSLSYDKLRFYTNIVEVWDRAGNYNGDRYKLYKIERNGNFTVDGLDKNDNDRLLFREYTIIGDELNVDLNYGWSGLAPRGTYKRITNLTPPAEISNLKHIYQTRDFDINNPATHEHYFTWTNPTDDDLKHILIIPYFNDGTFSTYYTIDKYLNPSVSIPCYQNEDKVIFRTVDMSMNASIGITFFLIDQ